MNTYQNRLIVRNGWFLSANNPICDGIVSIPFRYTHNKEKSIDIWQSKRFYCWFNEYGTKGVCNLVSTFRHLILSKMEMHNTNNQFHISHTYASTFTRCDIDFITHRLPNKIQMCTFHLVRPISTTLFFVFSIHSQSFEILGVHRCYLMKSTWFFTTVLFSS